MLASKSGCWEFYHDPLQHWSKWKLLKVSTKSLFESVRAIVRWKKFPVQFLAAYRWLLKRVKNPDDSITTEVDRIYYQPGTDNLNDQGLVHFHLLLAKELKLRKINYA